MDLEEMEMKKIEDPTERQMAYSERRKEFLKEADELSVLCDDEIAIFMCSSTNEMHGYTSPNSTMKKIIDQYQSTLGIDLRTTHYEKMQEELRRLKDINSTLRRDIKQRIGEELNDLNMEQLCSLEDSMLESLKEIQTRKFRLLINQTDIYKMKIINLQDMQYYLRRELVMKHGYPHEGGEDSALAFANDISNLTAMQQRLSLGDVHVEGSFDYENSCIRRATTVEVENSP